MAQTRISVEALETSDPNTVIAFDENGEPITIDTPKNPVGTVLQGYWSTAPDGYLELNGASGLSRTAYSDLFAHLNGAGLIVSEGSKAGHEFGDGDGSTTFSLADTRDLFFRAKSSGRSLGDFQADNLKSHTHTYRNGTNENGQFGNFGNTMPFGIRNPITDRNASFTGGSETRPKNIALMTCIKF